MKLTSKNSFRIGLYVRVSTEEQAQNPEGSIKSQEQRLRQYIEFKNLEGNFGNACDLFIDRAKSGKDTNRPQLQRLLECIRKGDINLVMVTELSRLSRSIRDFTDMWELMKEQSCGFLSLREQFDTTTAAGEMVLYTIANMSQFERKQISERVSANFLARAKGGLFNGGRAPFGYTMDPHRRGHLNIVESDAALVQTAFAAYLEHGTLLSTAKHLNDHGYQFTRSQTGGGNKARLGYFTVSSLKGLLRNQAYVGQRPYLEHGHKKLATACWEPIVDIDTFERVQTLMTKNFEGRVKPNYPNRYPFLLSSLAFCGSCGDRLPGKSAHGNSGKVPYYDHGWAAKRQSSMSKPIFNCKLTRFRAQIIEPLVWDDVARLLSGKELAMDLIARANALHESNPHTVECDQLRQRIKNTDAQLEALAEHLSKIPKSVAPAPFYAQMERLNEAKTNQQNTLNQILASAQFVDKPADLMDYESYLKSLNDVISSVALPEDKNALVKALVHKVEVFPDHVKIHYFVGETRVLVQNRRLRSLSENSKLRQSSKNLGKSNSNHESKNFLVRGSKKELISDP